MDIMTAKTAAYAAETTAEERRISELLTDFRNSLPAGRVTLADLVAVLKHRAFGGFLLALALPTLLPLPLGTTYIFDIPLALIAAQLVMGRSSVWLPRFLLRQGVGSQRAGRMLDALIPRLRRLENVLRPRYEWLSGPAGERWVGWLILLNCFVLAWPIPVLGWFPAFALVALTLGLVERDGLVLLIGMLLSAVTVMVSVALLVGVAHASELLLDKMGVPLPFTR
jgi:hypothetical protein